MPLLDEAIAARSGLGRDDYDAKRWRDEGTDIREEIVSSRSTVINATDGTRETIVPVQTTPLQQAPAPQQANTASNIAANYQKPAEQPQTQAANSDKPLVTKTVDSRPLNEPQPQQKAVVPASNNDDTPRMQVFQKPEQTDSAKTTETSSGTVNVGSLLGYATEKVAPAYPSAAKSMRAAGIVKVVVVLDENGQVAEVKNVSGPSLLVAAAKDAIHKWKFRPVTRDGQAVRAEGYVNFNFTL
jgi:protein TonB